MMIDAPAREPVVTVVADNSEVEEEAARVSAALRAARVMVDNSYKAKPKRQAEIARKNGNSAVLYVRAGSDAVPNAHVTFLTDEEQARDAIFKTISESLPNLRVTRSDQ